MKRLLAVLVLLAALLPATAPAQISGVDPQLRLRETDQVLPAGLWRLRLNGNTFTLERNTDATGAFGTVTVPISVSSSDIVTFLNAPIYTALSASRLVKTGADKSLASFSDGSAGQVLQSAGAALPAYSTATYPSTTTINQILYSSAANTVAGLATGNSSILATSAAGVPSLSTDIPTAVTIGSAYIYRAAGTDVPLADGGTNASLTAVQGGVVYSGAAALAISAAGSAGQMLQSAGTNTPVWTPATYPATAAGAGTVLRANGTNWLASTSTFADTYTAGDLLVATGANTVGSLAAVAVNQVLASAGAGTVPAYTATPTIGTSVTVGASATYDGIIISPVAKGANQFDGTVTSSDLTAARQWTFPNASITVNAAGDLSGTTLAAGVVTSSLTAVGTIATGTWSATEIDETKGGTGLTSYVVGDTLYASATNTLAKLAGNTTKTRKWMLSVGDGVNATAPSWDEVSKSDVGLGNVENTALSTWVGSTNITTVGTIATGTWNAAFTDAALTAIDAGTWTGAASITTLGTITTGTWNAGFTDASLTAIDAGTWTGATSITTLGTVTTGAWNAGAVTSSSTLVAGTTGRFGDAATYDGIIISPVAKGANQFDGTITSVDLTAARTWTFPNAAITVNAAADISGTTLASNVITSSLTSVGTITTGVWNAGAVTSSGAITSTLAAGNSLVIDTTVLVVDASNDRVGIGTASPTTLLHVSGSSDPTINITHTGLPRTWSMVVDGGYDFAIAAVGVGTPFKIIDTTQDIILNQNGGKTLIGDTSNANNTAGLTVNQGPADDEVFSAKSSDVAHPFTSWSETDTFGHLNKAEATSGGMEVRGLKDADGAAGRALMLRGMLGEAADTTKSTGGIGVVEIAAAVTDGGTSAAGLGADGNLLSISNYGTTRFIFDAEGEAHADVAWSAFDAFDDIGLLKALNVTHTPLDPIKGEFGSWLSENRSILQANKIVNYYDPTGKRAMVNFSKLAMLHTGSIIQVSDRLGFIDQRVAQLEAQVAQLAAQLAARQ